MDRKKFIKKKIEMKEVAEKRRRRLDEYTEEETSTLYQELTAE